MKYLIINADDFGYSKIFNSEILALAEQKLISSTTVMVNRITEEQDEQIQGLIKLVQAKHLSVGLHFEFAEVDLKEEIERQYEKFISIFKFSPSHIDLHKSIYLQQAYPVIMEFCKRNNLPCRNHGMDNKTVLTTTSEVVDGTKMNLEKLKQTIQTFKDEESYEILFHPGTYDPNCKSSLNEARKDDVEKIKKIQQLLREKDIKLIGYLELNK